VGVNRKTAAYYFHRLREIIYCAIEDETPFAGEIEVDESYFGGHRKGKRGRGAAGKVPVFGILKRGGRVYTKVILNAKATTLLPIMQRRIVPDSIVYSDCLPSYNVLDVSDFRHHRINHSKLLWFRLRMPHTRKLSSPKMRQHLSGIHFYSNGFPPKRE